ncbi:SusC/RagA family TonB-linked outer membrane protein [Flaviramulus sp. BrNp1-15]|uniref:SusC/RagA family TonB-linked outer membrane protein n=1 Tax=Flaviramulus sp. BrNp1-15 TaxID=2916754 RepID=UPI001EE868BA|nr:SusC/RagA family TonB-linked outer membrane protein [Flaviramulus sp. BrNp1-15]ULC60362.1 SusC/RagA family TonB-linked outer membrane protein [Flaviramulus sp. BrNp1-15]
MMNFFREKKNQVNTVQKICTLLLLCFSVMSFAQQLTVSGFVTDEVDGSPIPGVNIIVKNTNNGVTTDFDGKYQIQANQNDILVFSFLGYETVEATVLSSTINIVLKEDTQNLDEIVVIGYGTTTVKDATGSVTAVTSKDFNKGNIVTPENLLNGRVAGLTINTGGDPGAGSTIRIRGGASLDASNDPLIVIDGLPIDNNTIGGSRSVLSTINPNDIDSFSVLKDASATAIYGSRASNGVIIITTKRGSKNLSANLDMQMGINTLTNTVDVFSADELRSVVAEQNPSLLPLLGNANTDWQKEIYRTGITSNLNLSIQGSLFDKLPARLSIGRTIQEGLRLTSKFERNTGSITLNPTFFDDHLKVSLNANGSFEKNRFAAGEEGNAITFDPTQPVYDSNSPFGGYFQYYNEDYNADGIINQDDLVSLAPFNPVANLLQNRSISEVKRIYGNIKFDYNFHFFPDLSAVVNIGYDEQSADGYVKISSENPLTQADGSILGSDSNYTNYQKNVLFDGYLAYNKELGKFNIDATVGYSFQKFDSDQYNTNELLDDTEASEPTLNIDPDLVLIGYFGRANFDFSNKYLLTLSYRRDGTSRFSEDNRWGNFPAAAFAWKINEDFFPDSETFSSLKLRLGWGITGQQDVGRDNSDLYFSRYVRGLPASQYQFGDQIIPIGIPQFRNEGLKWEETTTYNAGFDFGLINDRFTGSIEAFYKESTDLLANTSISDGSNFSNAGFQNVGDFSTQGLEFAISGDVIKKENFNWNVNFNTTLIKIQMDKLALDVDQETGGIAGGTGGNIQLRRVGFNPFSFFVYKQIYNAEGQPIEGAYADLNGDNQITPEDRYLYRKGVPDVTMGFLSNMSYKNFDLSFNLRASIGNYIYNNVNSIRAQYNLLQNNAVVSNLTTSVLDSGFNLTEDVLRSDYYVENGSFLRMDNITLGHTFNKLFSENSSFRISASVQNVFVITNYSGLDPEVFEQGIDNTIYPRPRTYTIGANFRF